MRRIRVCVMAVLLLAVLAGCGNKGPLVRPAATGAMAMTG